MPDNEFFVLIRCSTPALEKANALTHFKPDGRDGLQ